MFDFSARLLASPVICKAALAVAIGCLLSPGLVGAQNTTDTGSATTPAAVLPVSAAAVSAEVKKNKAVYAGPSNIVVLPATPMLDAEGKQRVDPDGKLMFNPPIDQIRDKKGHPVFDTDGKPVFQTASNLGYDEKGKKIPVKKIKRPKTTPMAIAGGTLTVDGWTGKARLNYDIADLKFLYIYAPGVGIAIVSLNPFPGATEQTGAFNDKALHITVEGHPLELASEKRLLAKKQEPAWVAVDRHFQLPSKFPVIGYGTINRAPYAWPGSKDVAGEIGTVMPPPLPSDLRPALLLAPCPAGMMRLAGPPVLPGQQAAAQACAPIRIVNVSTQTATPTSTK